MGSCTSPGRYGVWFAASVKFLIPFGVLVSLGSLAPRRAAAPEASRQWVIAVEQVSTPAASVFRVDAPVERGHADWIGIGAVILWACGFAGVAGI
jgi:hypothetical protein